MQASVIMFGRFCISCFSALQSVLCAQVALLEWTDDMEVFILKGYGNSLNYKMGVPLLQDIVQSMEKAITAKEGIYNDLT